MKQFWIILIIVALFNCSEEEGAFEYDFGYDYSMLINDSLPVILNDSLHVRLAYSGCDGGHEFVIQEHFSDSDTVKVWLKKLTEDQPCDAYFEENRIYLLSSSVMISEHIVLLRPNGAGIVLRD